jgi:DNA-directed RNA polymerase specialized sigma24 family protein
MIENAEFAQFAARIMRAMARRAGADVDLLPVLRDVQREIDALMRQSVAACRAEGYSWAEIAARLGTTRQAAQQRYGRSIRARFSTQM